MHNLLSWPAVQALLDRRRVPESQSFDGGRGAESWLMHICADVPNLVVDRPIDIRCSEFGVLVLPPFPNDNLVAHLTRAYVEHISEEYFRTFHYYYPILDISHFHYYLLPRVLTESSHESSDNFTLVLLILALGSVAKEGLTSDSFIDEAGRDTGVKGGTIERPPG